MGAGCGCANTQQCWQYVLVPLPAVPVSWIKCSFWETGSRGFWGQHRRLRVLPVIAAEFTVSLSELAVTAARQESEVSGL